MNKRYSLQFLTIIGLMLAAAATLAQSTISLHGDSRIVFASAGVARDLLARPDRYLQGLSRFDRQSRLGTDASTNTEAFIQRAQSEVRSWQKDEKRRLTKISKRLSRKLRPYHLSLPAEIKLIKVQGLMEGGAAYTRHNAIILPVNYLQSKTDKQLEFLLAHELFHILSRFNPDLRTQAYAVIGFTPCNEISLPQGLAEMKISNPDAPRNDFYIEVLVKDKKVKVIPVIYSSEPFNPNQDRTFFDYLKLGFLQINNIEGEYRAIVKNNVPMIYPIHDLNNFFQQIGSNTRYIIHPEEIMADNFAMMLMKTEPLPSPDIHIQLKSLLQN